MKVPEGEAIAAWRAANGATIRATAVHFAGSTAIETSVAGQ